MTPVSAANAEHYRWGDGCDGWYLVRTDAMNIIEEKMPPHTCETRHFHTRARQFFYVLEGELTMEVEREEFVLGVGEGIEVAPGKSHQVSNRSRKSTRFLLTSQPPSHGDRVEQAD